MGDRRDIGDAGNFETSIVQRTNRRVSARTRAFHTNIQVLYAEFLCSLSTTIRSDLGSEGRALPGSTETGTTRGGPAQSIALTITDGNDGVIERRMDMRDSISYRLFDFLL